MLGFAAAAPDYCPRLASGCVCQVAFVLINHGLNKELSSFVRRAHQRTRRNIPATAYGSCNEKLMTGIALTSVLKRRLLSFVCRHAAATSKQLASSNFSLLYLTKFANKQLRQVTRSTCKVITAELPEANDVFPKYSPVLKLLLCDMLFDWQVQWCRLQILTKGQYVHTLHKQSKAK